MNNGFTILEVLFSLALSLTILTMVISSVTEGAVVSKNVSEKQDMMESLFFTVDSIKNDLTKCGMRLQEAVNLFGFKPIKNTPSSFKIIYGISSTALTSNAYAKDDFVEVSDSEAFKKNKKFLIYYADDDIYDILKIREKQKIKVFIKTSLKNDFPLSSQVIALKEIEYKYYPETKILKKRVDSGYFQPLLENVTDFYVTYFPDSNSVLYRIEIGNKEQVRGYIYLSNLSG